MNATDGLNPSGLLVGNLQLGTTSLPISGLAAAGNIQALGTSQVLLDAAVPEPSSIISLGLGGLVVEAGLRKRGRRGVA